MLVLTKSTKTVQMEPERLRRKEFVKQMSFCSGVKGEGRDWWWDYVHIMAAALFINRVRIVRGIGRFNPPVHVYRRSFLSENRL